MKRLIICLILLFATEAMAFDGFKPFTIQPITPAIEAFKAQIEAARKPFPEFNFPEIQIPVIDIQPIIIDSNTMIWREGISVGPGEYSVGFGWRIILNP